MKSTESPQNDHHPKSSYSSDRSSITFTKLFNATTFVTTKYSVKLKVSDSQTGEPVKDVLACILNAENPRGATFKLTAERGTLNIRSLAAGSYLVTLKKAGYSSQTVKIDLQHNQSSVVNIKLDTN